MFQSCRAQGFNSSLGPGSSAPEHRTERQPPISPSQAVVQAGFPGPPSVPRRRSQLPPLGSQSQGTRRAKQNSISQSLQTSLLTPSDIGEPIVGSPLLFSGVRLPLPNIGHTLCRPHGLASVVSQQASLLSPSTGKAVGRVFKGTDRRRDALFMSCAAFVPVRK